MAGRQSGAEQAVRQPGTIGANRPWGWPYDLPAGGPLPKTALGFVLAQVLERARLRAPPANPLSRRRPPFIVLPGAPESVAPPRPCEGCLARLAPRLSHRGLAGDRRSPVRRGEDGQSMPSTPLTADHQESLRNLIGKVLPEAGTQHIAETAAAAYCHLARIIHRTARNRPRPPNTWARDFIAKNFIKQPIRIVVNDIKGLALIAHFS